MKHSEFEIGKTFFASAGFEWLCTDKGTRTITAIHLDPEKDPSWFNGPPYAVAEVVWDEYDLPACTNGKDDFIVNRINKNKLSCHPGFDADDMFKMIDCQSEIDTNYDNLLKQDRVTSDGSIVHPYSVYWDNSILIIKLFEIFSKQYLEMKADEFITLPYSTEEAMKKRSEGFSI